MYYRCGEVQCSNWGDRQMKMRKRLAMFGARSKAVHEEEGETDHCG